jgi:hypothetical protein
VRRVEQVLPRAARGPWRGIASRQENFVHKSSSFPESPSASQIDQAYERARQRMIASAERAGPEPASAPAEHDAEPEPRTVEPPLSGPELCRVLREPLAWLLSLAYGLAVHDPLDLAAVHRVRAATLARLAGQPAGFRASDVLTVFALLFGALDPAVVFDAVTGALGNSVGALLRAELPAWLYITSIPDPRAPRRTQVVCTLRSAPQVGR